MGIQGRAAMADLAASPSFEVIIRVDLDLTEFTAKVTPVKLDASSKASSDT